MRFGILVLLVGCADKEPADTGVALAGPTLSHTPPASVLAGTDVTFDVVAIDPDGIGPVSLYHRVQGDPTWGLTPMEAAEDDRFTATIEGENIVSPGIEYYFKADDAADVTSYSYLPAENTAAPYVLAVSLVGSGLPFYEGFEYEEGVASFYALGWANAGLGFRGYAWDVSGTQAADGTQSAYHARGHTDISEMEDWLLSPAIDLSGVASAQVTWQERGANVGTANHGLYISTGSRDPADGAYVAVAEALPAPAEGAWGRSAVYDLSAWVGSSAVYLAWRFVGDNADDWFIDAIAVEALQADITVDTSASPAPLDPGGAGTFTVTVTNAGTVASEDLTVRVAFPEGGASVAEESVAVAPVGATSAGSADFSLLVEPTTLDNSYVPVAVTVTDGTTTWALDDTLLVGVASTLSIEYAPREAGSLSLVIGVGDPEAPLWEQTVYSDDASTPVALALDITDQRASLPPAPGDARWYLRASPEVIGEITNFTIQYDGVDYAATVLPPAPPGAETLAYLPEPAALRVVVSSSAAPLEPGTVGATLTLVVGNDGAATSGALMATLSSADTDVTVTDAGPVAVTGGALTAGATEVVSGVFAFDVAVTHTDSSDLGLEILLDDGVESWLLPVSVSVPYPYLQITAIEIEDDDGDGEIDIAETAELTFELTNAGDLPTSGALVGTLVAEASSTASVTITGDPVSFDRIGSGASESGDDPWLLGVDSGVDGDSIDLLLTLTDGARSYEVRTSIRLGEPPWQELDRSGDPVGDVLDGWDFDLAGGRYRVDDGILQIRLESHTVFDPASLFVEAWGLSTAADWTYYRLVLQSGVASLQGYNGGFTDISTPVVTYPSPTEMQFDIPVADMGLVVDSVSFGFATGWCGPDEYYCDHFPDGWGYPYAGWAPSLFFDLTW